MSPPPRKDGPTGLLFDVDTFAVHDGPGIRMAVYFKGCPLACRWCHSPESQRFEPELIFLRDRCTLCAACARACPQNVHGVSESHEIDRARCKACGRCVLQCPGEALEIKGKEHTVDEIVRRAERLKPFFRHSGGGVTLTGGEVTLQPAFARAVLDGCRRCGIHTAIETCGACRPKVLEQVTDGCDLVLYDLKLMDEAAHRRWTGVGNRLILRNAARLDPGKTVIRVPLIPGVTDTEENVTAIYRFAKEHRFSRVSLMPYNPSSGAKYEWLGRAYELSGEPQDPAQLQNLQALGRDQRLEVSI